MYLRTSQRQTDMLQKYVLFCASSFLQSIVCLLWVVAKWQGCSLCILMNDFFCSFHLIHSLMQMRERQVQTRYRHSHVTCQYLPHMWTDWSCWAHGTREHVSGGGTGGLEKVGHRAPRSRDDKTQTGSLETIRMSADDIIRMQDLCNKVSLFSTSRPKS